MVQAKAGPYSLRHQPSSNNTIRIRNWEERAIASTESFTDLSSSHCVGGLIVIPMAFPTAPAAINQGIPCWKDTVSCCGFTTPANLERAELTAIRLSSSLS